MHFIFILPDVIGVIHNHSNVILKTKENAQIGAYSQNPSSTLIKYNPTTFVVHAPVRLQS